jgi:hypothetical protein
MASDDDNEGCVELIFYACVVCIFTWLSSPLWGTVLSVFDYDSQTINHPLGCNLEGREEGLVDVSVHKMERLGVAITEWLVE